MFWVLKRDGSFRLTETVLLSTHNIHFGLELRKIIFKYAPLSGGLFVNTTASEQDRQKQVVL